MSVPKSSRNASLLEVLIETRKLAVYTIRLCSDEQRIPKRYRWCIANETIQAAVKASEYCAKANSVYVNDEASYLKRRGYQQDELAELEALESNMIIAFELFDGLKHMDADDKPKKRINIAFWASQKTKVKAMLLAWKKSDAEHFKSMADR